MNSFAEISGVSIFFASSPRFTYRVTSVAFNLAP